MEKYYNDKGEVGVLVSYGYGAGWSTWNTEHREFLVMDKTLVEMALREASVDEVSAYIEKRLLDDSVYTGGWGGIAVEFYKPNTQFSMEEYDGAEDIRTVSDLYLTT